MIAYSDGMKYQLREEYQVQTNIKPLDDIMTEWICLSQEGVLTLAKDYAWDGPSGIAIDTKNFMRGSLVHDALYMLLRKGYLPGWAREVADEELRRICLEDGMSRIRAWWVYKAVRLAAGNAALPSRQRRVLYAP